MEENFDESLKKYNALLTHSKDSIIGFSCGLHYSLYRSQVLYAAGPNIDITMACDPIVSFFPHIKAVEAY